MLKFEEQKNLNPHIQILEHLILDNVLERNERYIKTYFMERFP